MNRNYAIAYAQEFLSFLFRDIKNEIKQIFIFGSAVRGELSEGSDIDIFIDGDINKKVVDTAVKKFYKSQNYQKWKLRNFTFPLKVKVGRLDEWELKDIVKNEGLLLYSAPLPKIEQKAIYIIKNPKEAKRYVKLKRMLFGRKEKIYRAKGLVDELKGQKLSSTVFIVPKQNIAVVSGLLAKEKINFRIIEVWTK